MENINNAFENAFSNINVAELPQVEVVKPSKKVVVSNNKANNKPVLKDRRGVVKKQHSHSQSNKDGVKRTPYSFGNMFLSLIKNPDGRSWDCEVGGIKLKLSTNFSKLRFAESQGRTKFNIYLNEKTLPHSKVIMMDNELVLIPDKGNSTTFAFASAGKEGTSTVTSVESESDNGTAEVFGDFSITTKFDVRNGKIVSHNGPIMVGFRRTGKLSIEEKNDLVVRVDFNGKSSIIY